MTCLAASSGEELSLNALASHRGGSGPARYDLGIQFACICTQGAPVDRQTLEQDPKDGDCVGCSDDHPMKRGLSGVRLRSDTSIFGCSIMDEQPGFHLWTETGHLDTCFW